MKHRSLIAALVVGAFLWFGSNNAFAVVFDGDLDWQTSMTAAFTKAKAQGKKVLLVAGTYHGYPEGRTGPSCATTDWTIDTATESVSPPIKSLIQQSFIPWFADVDLDSDIARFRPRVGDLDAFGRRLVSTTIDPNATHLPLIIVIDQVTMTRLDWTYGAPELSTFYTRLLRYESAACTFDISPSGNTFSSSGSTGNSIHVTPTSSTCSWTAVRSNSWITITSGSSGTGPGTVTYSVSANNGGPRTGTITIGGNDFDIVQSGTTACTSTISPTSSPVLRASPTCTAMGCGSITGTVSVSSTCSWGATSTDPWITVTAPAGLGNGNGTVSYTVSPNTGAPRTGTITIGGKTFTVSQDGSAPCTFAVSPTPYPAFNGSGNNGTITVTPSAGSCSWSATSSDPSWIQITWGSGTGTGDVTFTITANPGAERTGTITIGDQTVTIAQATATKPLYFLHVDTSLPWQTEIALINTGDQPVTGLLKALSDNGELVGEPMNVSLPARGRKQIVVAGEFAYPTDSTDIGYIIFESTSDAVQGYTKLYQEGIYREATPAVRAPSTSDIYIPHIASDAQWWTGICLVNTTSAEKILTIAFNNGQSKTISLAAKEHQVFTIAGLFSNQPQPDIKSAVITNAGGIIGMEVFGGTFGGKSLMDGILLTDKTASTIYYPHVAGDGWWTGIAAYNPLGATSALTITPYSAQGLPLPFLTHSLAGQEKYIGTPASLGLPAETAWFKIDSTLPLAGFELIGTTDYQQLAAYSSGGGTGAKAGVLAKIEKLGSTSIIFVNTEDGAASVVLTAYDNNGNSVAVGTLAVGGHAKEVRLAEALFAQDIGSATYIAYTSDRNVVGLQLNASADGMMLDGLPALGGAN